MKSAATRAALTVARSPVAQDDYHALSSPSAPDRYVAFRVVR